jgi:hypothetical protein
MLLALAACHSDSSSSVRIQVNNSIDDENPNLIVDIVVRDDDDEDTGAAAAAQPAIIEAGTVGPVIEATDKGSLRAPQSAALAYLSLAAHGRPRGIAIADPAGQTVAWIASEAIDALSEPSWSLDGERLIFVGADGVHASERSPGAVHAWTEPVQIAALPDASASDGGPLLERQVDGELAVFGAQLLHPVRRRTSSRSSVMHAVRSWVCRT